MSVSTTSVRNRIRKLLDREKVTRYKFWKATGLSQTTAYRLCDDDTAIPSAQVMSRIYEAYRWQPGDYLYVEEKEKA